MLSVNIKLFSERVWGYFKTWTFDVQISRAFVSIICIYRWHFTDIKLRVESFAYKCKIHYTVMYFLRETDVLIARYPLRKIFWNVLLGDGMHYANVLMIFDQENYWCGFTHVLVILSFSQFTLWSKTSTPSLVISRRMFGPYGPWHTKIN